MSFWSKIQNDYNNYDDEIAVNSTDSHNILGVIQPFHINYFTLHKNSNE